MSRVGNTAIQIPSEVTVTSSDHQVSVKGPLGELSMEFRPEIQVEVDEKNGQVTIRRRKEDRISRSLHGLIRSLVANMVTGVKTGWQRKLELVGVGFRAQVMGEKLVLNIGFSHPVEIMAPLGIKFTVEDNTKITVSGVDKQLVGQVAASIRKIKPPEPYQGKGIRFTGEYVRRKAGKAGKAGAGAK